VLSSQYLVVESVGRSPESCTLSDLSSATTYPARRPWVHARPAGKTAKAVGGWWEAGGRLFLSISPKNVPKKKCMGYPPDQENHNYFHPFSTPQYRSYLQHGLSHLNSGIRGDSQRWALTALSSQRWALTALGSQCSELSKHWAISAGLSQRWPISAGLSQLWPLSAGLSQRWPLSAGLSLLQPIRYDTRECHLFRSER